MDDGEFDRGKDSAQQRNAINLPLACLPIAYAVFLPLDTGSYGVFAALHERQQLAALYRSRLQSLLVKSDATGGQVQGNSAPDNQTTTTHTKNPSCASPQEGFFVCSRSVFSLTQLGEQLGRYFLAIGGELVGAELVHLTL